MKFIHNYIEQAKLEDQVCKDMIKKGVFLIVKCKCGEVVLVSLCNPFQYHRDIVNERLNEIPTDDFTIEYVKGSVKLGMCKCKID